MEDTKPASFSQQNVELLMVLREIADALRAPFNTAPWTPWTPTVTAGSGAFTTASGTGRFKIVGTTVFWQAQFTITTIGTGAGCLFTLPAIAQSSSAVIGSAREAALTGLSGTAILASSSQGSIARYDNGNIASGGSGTVIRASGSYELA